MEVGDPGRLEGEDLADLVRSVRLERGLTQEQLARELGVSFVTVNRWESGRAKSSPGHTRALRELAVSGARRERSAVPLTSFVGRRQEMAELKALLESARLVTVVGPGGVGKSRLVAELLGELPAGRLVEVALEPISQQAGVITAIADRLKLRDRSGVEPIDALASALSGEESLLVLDGAEHLHDEVGELARELLRRTPACRVLVTSRRVLGVAGELVFPLRPLSCPPAEAPAPAVLDSDAVRLLLARARQRVPSLDPDELEPKKLTALCRSLDGLPLAIELIAGWIGTFSLGELLERAPLLLEASHPGPASGLSEVARHSWELLTEPQQRFLAQLSVIRGSFELADAAAVAGCEAGEAALLLRQLVDSSWLVVIPAAEVNRFQMLETMRSFLSDRLDPVSAAAARERHAERFTALARRPENMTPAQAAAWSEKVANSWPDVEQALSYLAATGNVEAGLETASQLWPWWLSSGRLELGRSQLESLLSATGQRDDELVARASCAAAILAAEHGSYEEALARAERAKRTFESYGRTADAAIAATVIGSASRYLDEVERARQAFSEALGLRRRLGDEGSIAVALNNLALLQLDSGEYERAEELFAESIELKRKKGVSLSLAIGLSNFSTVLIRRGRLEEAARLIEEARLILRGQANPQLEGSIAANCGELAAAKGEWTEALQHYETSLAAEKRGGHAHDEVVALLGAARALLALDRREEARRSLRDAEVLASRSGNLAGLNKVRALLGEMAEEPLSPPPGGLTVREAEVLRLLALGRSTKEIASELELKVSTVENHLGSIYRKLPANGRVEATRWAVAHGLVGAGA